MRTASADNVTLVVVKSSHGTGDLSDDRPAQTMPTA
jgi:hypothetical protein